MAGTPLRPDQIDDMVIATLPELGHFKWTDISFTLREHIVADRLMKKNRVSFSSGEAIEWNVKVNNGQQAKVSGLFDTDDVNVDNVLKKARATWSFANTHWAYDNREPAFNSGKSQILDLMKVRKSEAMQSIVELFEKHFWQAPSATKELEPLGLQYWVVKNATEGFNGGTPAGFSNVAGLNTTTYDQWRNWTAQYAAVGKTDLIRKARKAHHYCGYKPPVKGNPYETGMDYTNFVAYQTLQELEEYLQTENENLGKDIAAYDGGVMFKRVPVEHAAKLDEDTSLPWYGINWGVFGMNFMTGQFAKESKPVEGSHNTRAIFYDWTYQYICRDRRRQFVLYK